MAVLKDLIVHGSSRFLNKIYANQIQAESGIFNKLIAKDLQAGKATVVGLLDVQGQLHTNAWTNSNIATIDGSFYITPTISSAEGTASNISATTIQFVPRNNTFAVVSSLYYYDTSAHEGTWLKYSKVLVTGQVQLNGEWIPLGTILGYLNADGLANSLVIAGAEDNKHRASPVLAQLVANGVTTSTSLNYRNLKVSLYQRSSSSSNNADAYKYPLGIFMTAMGTNGKTFLDIYGGGNVLTTTYGGYADPNVRIGNLSGLPVVGNQTPVGWGIYTTNGYFKGTVAADNGYIGGASISNGVLTVPAANVSGELTAATINGSKITANTITASQIASNAITADELAANAVTSAKIKAGEVKATNIASNAVTADKLDATTINASNKLTVGAMTTDTQTSIENKNIYNNKFYQYKKDIIVYGDSNKYYPVYFNNTSGIYSQNDTHRISLYRNYNQQAPNDWNTSTHKGGLTLNIKWNYGGWGGATYNCEITEFTELYSTMVGDVQVAVGSGMTSAIFLRGGGETGALYHIYCDVPIETARYNGTFPAIGNNENTGTDYMYTGSYHWKYATPLTTPNTIHIKSLIAKNTAVNYITDIDSNKGITIKPADTSGNDYLQINSSAINFYRNNVETLKIEDSAIRVGKLGDNLRNVYITDSAVQIRNNEAVLAEYGSSIKLYQPTTTTVAVEISSTGATFTGNVKATSLSTGTKTAAETGKGTFINSSGAIYVGNGSTNNFTVTDTGTITATGANLLTATIGNATNKITIGTGTSGHSSVRYGLTTLSDTSHDGFYIGTDGIALGKGVFKVTNTGTVTATDAHITGEIVATSGRIGGIDIENGTLKYSSIPMSSLGGAENYAETNYVDNSIGSLENSFQAQADTLTEGIGTVASDLSNYQESNNQAIGDLINADNTLNEAIESLNLTITNGLNIVNGDLGNVKSWITFDTEPQPRMRLGKSDSPVYAYMTNDRLEFRYANNDNPVAYIAGDNGIGKLYATNSVIVQDMQFGNWAWYQRSNGHMSVKWVGEE